MTRRRNRGNRTEAADTPPRPPDRFRAALPALLLAAALLVAYAPALDAGFVWDDDFYVTANDTLRDLAGLKRIWLETDANPQYYPVTFTTFWLQYRVHGAAPFGYHIVNVLLHAASAVLLWRILRSLRVPGALLAGWIFALHPVMVESVAWITERKNVLSGVLYLSAALLYLRFSLGDADAGPAGTRPAGTRRLALLSLLLFALALLAKSVTATLPVALCLVVLWKRRHLPREDALWLGAMLAIGVAMGILTAWIEWHQVGAGGAEWTLTLAQKCLLAGRVVAFYLGKLVWPASLSFFYDRWTVDPGDPVQYLFPLAALAVLVTLRLARRRIGDGPLVASLYFIVTLAPVLGFFRVFPMKYSWVADHFQYLAGIGPIALFAATATLTFRGRAGPRLALAAALPLVLVLGVLAWKQAHDYHDIETLWTRTVERTPSAWAAQYALGNLCDERGDVEGAIRHHELALKAKPDYAEAFNNLGAIRAGQRRTAEAIDLYRHAIRVKPELAIAHYNLARSLEAEGRIDETIEALKEAIRRSPDPSASKNHIWSILFKRGDMAPPPGKARRELGRLLAGKGRVREAVESYRASLAESPDSPECWTGLGQLLTDGGDYDEAIACFERALGLRPDDPAAHLELGLAAERKGDLDRSLSEYRECIRLRPRSPEAHHNLAVVLFRRGDAAGAWSEVALARDLGLEPSADFVRALSALMPDPSAKPARPR